MTSEFITRHEAEVLCEGALQSKFTKLMNDRMRTNTERAFALASLETVEAELNRKQSQTPDWRHRDAGRETRGAAPGAPFILARRSA